MKVDATAIAWYTPDTYDEIKSMSDDADEFSDTFNEWLDQAQRKLSSDEFRGVKVVRVNVNPGELLAFCRAQNSNINAHSRSEFAAHKVAQNLLDK